MSSKAVKSIMEYMPTKEDESDLQLVQAKIDPDIFKAANEARKLDRRTWRQIFEAGCLAYLDARKK